eukprot:11626981-Alexandrium_andersonii.AAC.1
MPGGPVGPTVAPRGPRRATNPANSSERPRPREIPAPDVKAPREELGPRTNDASCNPGSKAWPARA